MFTDQNQDDNFVSVQTNEANGVRARCGTKSAVIALFLVTSSIGINYSLYNQNVSTVQYESLDSDTTQQVNVLEEENLNELYFEGVGGMLNPNNQFLSTQTSQVDLTNIPYTTESPFGQPFEQVNTGSSGQPVVKINSFSNGLEEAISSIQKVAEQQQLKQKEQDSTIEKETQLTGTDAQKYKPVMKKETPYPEMIPHQERPLPEPIKIDEKLVMKKEKLYPMIEHRENIEPKVLKPVMKKYTPQPWIEHQEYIEPRVLKSDVKGSAEDKSPVVNKPLRDDPLNFDNVFSKVEEKIKNNQGLKQKSEQVSHKEAPQSQDVKVAKDEELVKDTYQQSLDENAAQSLVSTVQQESQTPVKLIDVSNKNDFCMINEQFNVNGSYRCTTSDECRGKRICNADGWCSGGQDFCALPHPCHFTEQDTCSNDLQCRGERTCNSGICGGSSGCPSQKQCQLNESLSAFGPGKCRFDFQCSGLRACTRDGQCVGQSGCKPSSFCDIDEIKTQSKCDTTMDCAGKRKCNDGKCVGQSLC